jgi:hypothetical protein
LDSTRFVASDNVRTNSSLGFAEAEMMRRLNIELGRGVDQVAYRRLVTGLISRQVLRRAAEPTPPPVLPPHAHEWAVQQSTEMVDELRGLGIRVVGDLNELIPPESSPRDDPTDPLRVDEADVAAAAIRAVAALVTRLAEDTSAEPTRLGAASASGGDERRSRRAGGRAGDRAARQAARRAARAGEAAPDESSDD